jgi:hypothetical protein
LTCYGISDGGAYPVGEHTLPGCIQPDSIVGDGETTFTITSYGTPCTTTTSTSTSTTSTTTFSPDPCICTEVVITSAGGEVETFNCFGVNENYVYMNAGTYHICAASIGGLLQAFFAEGTTGTISPVGNCKTQTCPPPTTTSTSTTTTSTTTAAPTTTTTTLPPTFQATISDGSEEDACAGGGYGTYSFQGSGTTLCNSITVTASIIASEIPLNGLFWLSDGVNVRQYRRNASPINTQIATAEAACTTCPAKTTSTSTTTSTTTTPPYDLYTADVFPCNDCGASIDTIVVAFDAGSTVVTNRFYIANGGPDGNSYRIAAPYGGAGPGLLLTTSFGSFTTCALACIA